MQWSNIRLNINRETRGKCIREFASVIRSLKTFRVSRFWFRKFRKWWFDITNNSQFWVTGSVQELRASSRQPASLWRWEWGSSTGIRLPCQSTRKGNKTSSNAGANGRRDRCMQATKRLKKWAWREPYCFLRVEIKTHYRLKTKYVCPIC